MCIDVSDATLVRFIEYLRCDGHLVHRRKILLFDVTAALLQRPAHLPLHRHARHLGPKDLPVEVQNL